MSPLVGISYGFGGWSQQSLTEVKHHERFAATRTAAIRVSGRCAAECASGSANEADKRQWQRCIETA